MTIIMNVRYSQTGKPFVKVTRPPKRGEYRELPGGVIEFGAANRKTAVYVEFVEVVVPKKSLRRRSV